MHRFDLRRDRVRASGPRAWEPCGLIGHPFLLDISDAASPRGPGGCSSPEPGTNWDWLRARARPL